MRLFNSGKVKFNPCGKVLEVGCGFAPAPQADVLLDLDKERIEKLKKQGKNAIVGDVLNLPFEDNSFDYIISMHLAEHLEVDELPKFFSEMERVAPRGYLEVPSIYWELLHNCDKLMIGGHYHKHYCFYDGGILHFIRKSDAYRVEHKILRELFRRFISKEIVGKYNDTFLIGFEWEKRVNYQIHNSLNRVPGDLLEKMINKIPYKSKPTLKEKIISKFL